MSGVWRLVATLSALAVLGAAPSPAPVLSDGMDTLASWRGEGSDSVAATSEAVPGDGAGKAVALKYDFGRVSGYAFMRRKIALVLPEQFELRFRLRGVGERNDLQVKLTAGDTVYWKTFPNFQPPGQWSEVIIPSSEIAFAWGPEPAAKLAAIDGIEFVVARNRGGGAGRIEIDRLEIVPTSGAAQTSAVAVTDPNAALFALAKAAPRGAYPRAFLNEQPYWTLAGSDGGKMAGLISEDGAIEPFKGGFSIEPALTVQSRRYTWANVQSRPMLAEGYLPVPSVEWQAGDVKLVTTLLVDPRGEGLRAGYTLTNRSKATRLVRLDLAVRPWQVNPPAQFLSQRGGFSPIAEIARQGAALTIMSPATNDAPAVTRTIIGSTVPDVATAGEVGGPFSPLGTATLKSAQSRASAVLSYRFTLPPGASRSISLAVPRERTAITPWPQLQAATLSYWRERLNRVRVRVPAAYQAVADTMRSTLAQILMSREGPMLKPGTRSYDRAWIRDGAMMAEGLLRMGSPAEVGRFADWYRSHLFDSGKVPCCVDFRGADPVPENDSQGEYIFLIAELHRYQADRAALEARWPSVLGAWRHMERLRASTRTPANLAPEKRMLYGLMPPSISHEGYSAKPQYSLWDDFWALRGYRDAAFLAAQVKAPEADAIAASRDQFTADLKAAITASAAHWRIDYIPGATSLGDFDATSTTVALDPGGARGDLVPAMLEATFERYWREFIARRDGKREWEAYTPYELRTVSSFIRLGWRDRAQQLLAYFMADRRPVGWNGWAEVVGRNPREVRFIGDMPHAWVASDFLRGALDLFAYNDEEARALVIGAGLTPDWLGGEGSKITGLATPYGTVDLALHGDARKLQIHIAGSAQPPGGFHYNWPFAGQPPPARIGSQNLAWQEKELVIPATGQPQTIDISR